MSSYVELGKALREKRLERAEELCRELLSAAPRDVELLALAGTLAHQKGDLASALQHFSAAALANPALPDLRNNLGVVLEAMGRHEEAASRYREALALKPQYCEATCNLGNALRSSGLTTEAVETYRRAIAIDPHYPHSYLGLANAQRAEGNWQGAVENYRKLLELQPDHLAGWINLGGSLLALNRFEEAIRAERRAIAITPGSADAHFNLALALLVTGDLRDGWREYEWRLKRPGSAFSDSFAGRAMWDGSPLNGRTLLLRCEQGFGDALQFFRYALHLARRGERVVLECRPELLQIFRSQTREVICFAAGEDPPPFDVFAYLLSLPFLLSVEKPFNLLCPTFDVEIPAGTPYLAADAGRVAKWRERIGSRGARKVGLVWAGSAGYRNDRSRSLSLRTLEPLAHLPGIDIYSLQLGAAAAELATAGWGRNVHDLSKEISDFADTAAIIANLDAVISVDTAVAHLAGAMGKPVLLMLPFSCDWRWLHGRDDSPWYPSTRLYRQASPGNWSSVIAAIVQDLSVEGNDPNLLFREANRLRTEGRYDEAIAVYRRLLASRPDLAEVHNNLGLALQDKGRLAEAADCYRRALALRPELADPYNNLGTVLVSQGEREAAIPCFEKALVLNEECIGAYINLGSALQYLDRPEEAVPLYRRAIELMPSCMEARINLGNAYQEMMRPEEPIAVYEEALLMAPRHPQAHWNLALSLLSAGDFERGWREYEWRLEDDRCGNRPAWDGASLAGKTILLECEQGLGDTLQFVRYAPLVAALGAEVLLQCQYASLKPLLARVEGVAAVFARGDDLPPFDCRVPLLSLPHIFGSTLDRLPATVPYLTPDLGRLATWKLRIQRGDALKVGLVWRGGPLPKNRACPYAEFAPLGGLAGVAFFSLQLGDAPDQRLLPAVDLSGEIHDFADTAAILATLDLVITVDTATAHLAGGMGLPVWTMLPYACDWRWMVGRKDSPWYPSMRLFRQRSRGDWRGVIAEMRGELERLKA